MCQLVRRMRLPVALDRCRWGIAYRVRWSSSRLFCMVGLHYLDCLGRPMYRDGHPGLTWEYRCPRRGCGKYFYY